MAAAEAAIPALAGLVSAAFAALVARQWFERRKPHQLAWGLGLAFYSIASLVEAYVALRGWTVPLYRLYFPLAAGLVGLLGAGTVFLLRKPLVARAFAGLVAALILVAALGQLTVPLTLDTLVSAEGEARPLTEWGTELGAKAVPFPHPARVASLVLNVAGGLALIVGAIWSWWQTRAPGVLLVGIGALLPFAGGTLSTLGLAQGRIVLQFAGVAVMFAGYLAGSAAARRQPPRTRAPSPGRS